MNLRTIALLCILPTSVRPTAATSQEPLASAIAPQPAVALTFPGNDPALQRALDRTLADPFYRRLIARKQLSVALVDLSDPAGIRYAAVDDDHMRYAASLAKIGIMLGVFDAVHRGELTYTPELTDKLERMIRRSENRVSTELIELVGFERIATTLRHPRYQFYGRARNGGLWVGKDYGGGSGVWQRDPLHNLSHGATARQVARFLVMMDRGDLVSGWASAEMKRIMGDPAIHHKFVAGLESRPRTVIYRKSGTYRRWHSDAAIVERDGRKYVAVALLDSQEWRGVLARLITDLDDIIMRRRAPLGRPGASGS